MTTDEREAREAAMVAHYNKWIEPVRSLETALNEIPESHKDRLREAMDTAIDAYKAHLAGKGVAGNVRDALFASTVSSYKRTIVIECNDHETKDTLLDFLTDPDNGVLAAAPSAPEAGANVSRGAHAVMDMLMLCGEEELDHIASPVLRLRALIDGLITQRRRAEEAEAKFAHPAPVAGDVELAYDSKGDCLYVTLKKAPADRGFQGDSGIIRRYKDGELIGVTIPDLADRIGLLQSRDALTGKLIDALLWIDNVDPETVSAAEEKFGFKLNELAWLPTKSVAAPDGWQPIETAPKDGTAILSVWWSNNDARGPISHIGIVTWAGAWTPYDRKPTHWMQLPAAPSPAGGETPCPSVDGGVSNAEAKIKVRLPWKCENCGRNNFHYRACDCASATPHPNAAGDVIERAARILCHTDNGSKPGQNCWRETEHSVCPTPDDCIYAMRDYGEQAKALAASGLLQSRDAGKE